MSLLARLTDLALHDGIVICHGVLPQCPEGPAIAWTDGLAVMVDTYCDGDVAAWAAAHLYGHCMSWAAAPTLRAWDRHKEPNNVCLAEVATYEAGAGNFGLYLVNKVSQNLSRWFVDRSEQDWEKYQKSLQSVGYKSPPTGLPTLDARVPTARPHRFEPGWAFDLR